MTRPPGAGIRSRVQLELDGEVLLAPDRADLLRAIDETGSITHAARKVGLSYKAAWDAIDTIGRRAAEPVVLRVIGGSKGGGTQLTEYGRGLLALVQRLERGHDGQHERAAPGSAPLPGGTLQTSARNHWDGHIRAVDAGPVRTEVRIALDPRRSFVAQITTASAEQLALARGMRITALVKAGAIAVAPPGAERAQPRRNRLRGVISAVADGEDRAEVTVRVSKSCSVVALVHKRRTEATLEVGSDVEVTFAPESVLLVVPR